MTVHRSRWLPVLCVCLAASCASSQPTTPPLTLPADPATALSQLREREDRIRTLRARFGTKTRVGDTSRSADGVLLVKKPDRFRLRLFLPLGLTVLDYLYRDGRTWMSAPLTEARGTSASEDIPAFSWDDLAAAFLRGTRAFPGSCTTLRGPAGNFEVVCEACDGCPGRRIEIAPDGRLLQESSIDDTGQRLLISYADYRSVDGHDLPFQVTLTYPRRALTLDISIRRYEVNPDLSDELFRPAASGE